MSYKVFFVEDEIVTREGIRDTVDWQADGFELCGEAPDGEVALPLVQATKPDVLITDIKMPFMDGLELSKIVRERLPQTKVVILSGHDEFEYAQQAIQLGVAEYLLKPVTVQDLHNVLQKLARKLKQEEKDRENLQKLQNQLDENHAALVERLLLKLVVGAISPADAIEESQVLGLDLISRCYLVVVIRIAVRDSQGAFDHQELSRAQEIVSNLTDQNPDVFLLRKGVEELALLVKGSSPEYLREDLDILLEQIQDEIRETKCQLSIGVGAPTSRIADIGHSFIEAIEVVQAAIGESRGGSGGSVETAELLKVDKAAVQDYLKCGVREDFDDFFDAFLLPLGETAFKSAIVKNYVILDILYATARFVQALGGEVEQVLAGMDQIDATLTRIETPEQFRAFAHELLSAAMEFRDMQANGLHSAVIQAAKEYIDQHYADPDISLHAVAGRVGHSPCHFSTVFGAETGQTFKEYLTELRIKRAKELIRTTALRSSEISEQTGYNDPHYFSVVFRKSTGMSPKEFRLKTQRVEK